MNPRIAAKLLFVLVMGLLFGGFSHHLHEKWSLEGSAAYLAHESEIFTKSYAHPRSSFHEIILWMMVVLILAVIYEGTALIAEKLFRSKPNYR